ncbi:MAG: type IV secretion system DNA-binding domain-containing protein [Mycoplasmataceae bacterium]|nr:type IV secretion system DNA-binding domain-containing protein [Mycoplasmataceae bacterium]
MYPLLKQLLEYDSPNLGMLILDVKGNFYKQVLEYAKLYNRRADIIVIELNSNVRYNPLDKPNLNASVLANRLKTILELFSPNNSESYWLDKAQEILTECIKLCRLYNNGYVTFTEIHNLINNENYYKSKINDLRLLFQSGKMSIKDIFNLYSSLNFFENEFNNLDSRTSSILKSEITRITGTFISDYDISKVFCPEKQDINFNSFKDVINNGKIVVLNMNIAEYKNLSKIIATYLKLDFQSEILSQLSSNKKINPTIFMCDEYHEYANTSDADFFAQSRESKCISIVATQSYSSLLNSLKDEASVKVIIQNLVNKLWLRTDDIFTIESAQKQIGREDKTKVSKNISENASETNYNYFTNSLKSKKSNLSESISTHIQTDFIYDTNFFTQNLTTFSCLAFISDGNKIAPPCKINLIPYFKKPEIETKNKSNLKIV